MMTPQTSDATKGYIPIAHNLTITKTKQKEAIKISYISQVRLHS